MHIESVYHGNMDERRNVRHVPPRQYNAPEKTVELIDRVSKKGDRSRFINEAVKRYVREVGRAKIRKELKAAYLEGAERDRQLAEEWFFLEEEAWQKNHP